MNNYVIQCVNDAALLWSNTVGWTDGDEFDVFSIEETETIDLPIDGQWVRLATL